MQVLHRWVIIRELWHMAPIYISCQKCIQHWNQGTLFEWIYRQLIRKLFWWQHTPCLAIFIVKSSKEMGKIETGIRGESNGFLVILIFIMVYFLYQLKRCWNRHHLFETETTEAIKSNFRVHKIYSGTTWIKREDEMNDLYSSLNIILKKQQGTSNHLTQKCVR